MYGAVKEHDIALSPCSCEDYAPGLAWVPLPEDAWGPSKLANGPWMVKVRQDGLMYLYHLTASGPPGALYRLVREEPFKMIDDVEAYIEERED